MRVDGYVPAIIQWARTVIYLLALFKDCKEHRYKGLFCRSVLIMTERGITKIMHKLTQDQREKLNFSTTNECFYKKCFFVLLSNKLCFKQTVIHKISYSTYHCRFGLSYRFFHKRMAPYKIPNYVLGISLMPSGRNRNHYQKHIKVLEHFQ